MFPFHLFLLEAAEGEHLRFRSWPGAGNAFVAVEIAEDSLREDVSFLAVELEIVEERLGNAGIAEDSLLEEGVVEIDPVLAFEAVPACAFVEEELRVEVFGIDPGPAFEVAHLACSFVVEVGLLVEVAGIDLVLAFVVVLAWEADLA